jgi:hypothetical protein
MVLAITLLFFSEMPLTVPASVTVELKVQLLMVKAPAVWFPPMVQLMS